MTTTVRPADTGEIARDIAEIHRVVHEATQVLPTVPPRTTHRRPAPYIGRHRVQEPPRDLVTERRARGFHSALVRSRSALQVLRRGGAQ
ncbi:hypothetical protein [Actinoplanes rectilineatus]|uniref:hypothetical protein n=1 Tax=Actinoplanes rectilineatus TaxID=113571 RepID=UPI0005F29B67|nr:hypothetical protein [Actinoplanes rectilineatus]